MHNRETKFFNEFVNFTGLKSFGNWFESSAIQEVTLPNNLSTIGYNCFYNSRIETITIPSSVTRIDSNAFREMGTTFKSIKMLCEEPPTLGNNVFYHDDNLNAIYVPSTSVEAYKAAANWNTYASLITPIQE